MVMVSEKLEYDLCFDNSRSIITCKMCMTPVCKIVVSISIITCKTCMTPVCKIVISISNMICYDLYKICVVLRYV